MPAQNTRSTRATRIANKASDTSTSTRKTRARPSRETEVEAAASADDSDGPLEEDAYDESLNSDELDEDVPKKKSSARSRMSKVHALPKHNKRVAGRKRTKQEADEGEAEDSASLDSDALDEDTPRSTKGKRKSPKKRKLQLASTRKNGKAAGGEDLHLSDDLEDGLEVVGVVVRAPTTGQVPPGQISQNTFNFLSELKKPECNDREWFKLHEPVYRLAEKEWKDFIEAFTDVLVDADNQIPHLPPKDVIHRIYRDIRFSNDKTPYKTGFSASFSRSGRKGIFACYHVAIRPGGESIIAAGAWHPGKNEINTIRNNLQRSSDRLRRIISDPRFEGLFGEAKPHPQGHRRSIFGMDDELKVAPKGVDKSHKDIDLLKCRSFAVVHRFTDKQVLQPSFKDELVRLVKIMRPFVHCINNLMTIRDPESEEDEGEGEGDANDGDDV